MYETQYVEVGNPLNTVGGVESSYLAQESLESSVLLRLANHLSVLHDKALLAGEQGLACSGKP
jgi:hypothetical protein